MLIYNGKLVACPSGVISSANEQVLLIIELKSSDVSLKLMTKPPDASLLYGRSIVGRQCQILELCRDKGIQNSCFKTFKDDKVL